MSKPALYGATLIRNGLTYDYPFRETLTSLAGLCQDVWIALGKSEDNTEAAVRSHKDAAKFHCIPTVWDENLRQSGLILSQQTNIALHALREQKKSGWIIYLQGDEVFSDHDFAQIQNDIEQAEATGCDAVSFRYLHFWQRYDQIAYAERWYPQEIRAIRVDRPIESYGDAQSFRGHTKVFASDVHVFHYGHVREESAYSKKQKDFHRWWHGDSELEKIWQKGAKSDLREPSLRYLGPHASFMQERIARHGISPPISKTFPILAWGSQADWNSAFVDRIDHVALHWSHERQDLKRYLPYQIVILRTLPLRECLKNYFEPYSRVPKSMLRKDARPWPREFWALLKFSERGVSIK